MMVITNWSVVSLVEEALESDGDTRLFQSPDQEGELYLLGMVIGIRQFSTVRLISLADIQTVSGAVIKVEGQQYEILDPKPTYEEGFPNARAELLNSVRLRLDRRKPASGTFRYSRASINSGGIGRMVKELAIIYAASVITGLMVLSILK
ncbi:hypothetical protein [Methylomagnum sp.]